MRIACGLFAFLFGALVIFIVARYGFKTSDNDADGYTWAFTYGGVTLGGLCGHAVAVRLWRHSQTASALVFLVATAALTISLSNSLGAMATRGNETQARRLKIAEDVRTLRRGLKRAEDERAALSFVYTDADTVAAARTKATAATGAKEAECKKRGDKCRALEADEKKALDDVEGAARNKSLTDRAKDLDTEIAGTKTRIERAGPVLEANSQGAAFARMFNLPESRAEFLSNWQNFAMAVTLEMMIVAAMIAFEILRHEKSASASEAKEISPASEPAKAFAFRKPRLVTSRSEPIGNVATIMAEIMKPGTAREKAEIADLFKAYAEACRQQGKRPAPPEEFSRAMQQLCEEIGIKITRKGDHVYLIKVRLKETEARVMQ